MSPQRYFFSLTDGTQTLIDYEGLELSSIGQAQERALHGGLLVLQHLRPVIEVSDPQGALLMAAPLALDYNLLSRDALTGLPTRSLFFQHLAETIFETGATPPQKFGILVFDIDRLKDTNDAFGYVAGDAVLRDVAEALSGLAADGNPAIARLDGDKFAIVLPDISSPRDAVSRAETILAAVSKPILHLELLLSKSVSGGLVLFPEHGVDAAELMGSADVALHVAKSTGGLVLYSRGMKNDQKRHLEALTDARNALETGRIVPFYQPKVSLSTNAVCGFEALLRVEDPLGIRPPGAIADALDHPALAVEIGRAIQTRVFESMEAWSAAHVRFGSIAINASAVELLQSSYARDLLARLDSCSLSPNTLQVEVTETGMVGQGSAKIEGELRSLRSSGVKVYLDDFGTGYGSLAHLRKFPIDGLKIDRSFVRDVVSDNHSRAIVRAIVQLAKSLDLLLVAEGIETSAQAQCLVDDGCDTGQGYLYGRAMPAKRVPQFLASNVVQMAPNERI